MSHGQVLAGPGGSVLGTRWLADSLNGGLDLAQSLEGIVRLENNIS